MTSLFILGTPGVMDIGSGVSVLSSHGCELRSSYIPKLSVNTQIELDKFHCEKQTLYALKIYLRLGFVVWLVYQHHQIDNFFSQWFQGTWDRNRYHISTGGKNLCNLFLCIKWKC